MDVPIEFCVIDDRKPGELKTMTISNYRRADVLKDFAKALSQGDLERALTWTAELHCSGKADAIWTVLLEEAPPLIGTANPNLLSWLLWRKGKYDELVSRFIPKYRHEHRNNQEMRNLLTDTVATVVLSKKIPIVLPEVTKADIAPAKTREKIISRSLRFCAGLLHEMDPNEIKLAVNEIANRLQLVELSPAEAIYWYLWLEQMDSTKKKYDGFICIPVEPALIEDPKWQADWVWPIWRAILREAQSRPQVAREVDAVLQVYREKFTTQAKKRRRGLLFYAIALLGETVKWKTPIIHDVPARIRACTGNNVFYRKVDELLDPYRTIGRTEYYTFVAPLTLPKEKKKAVRQKEREEKRVETVKSKMRGFDEILSICPPRVPLEPAPPSADPLEDPGSQEVRVVSFGL